MSEPKVTYVEDQSETSSELVKNVEKDPESNIVEFIKVTDEKVQELKDACDNKDAFLDQAVDLKEWQDPWVNLCLGIKPHEFLKKVLDKGLFEAEASSLGYSDLKLSISLMEFLKFKDLKIVDNFKETCEKKFPQILLLMNINGCLVHRTDS